MKRNGMCPICYLKKIFLPTKHTEKVPDAPVYETGGRQTPLMGWSSWNTFRGNIDQTLIYETALALKEKGLADAGYVYVNLDDCWQSNNRDDDGNLQGNLTSFSDGIASLVNKVNALGLKLGLYSSNGVLTCEDLPASFGNERRDSLTVARWGTEYFKYDFCWNKRISSYAPLVYGITVAPLGSENGDFYSCSNGKVDGLARFMSWDKVDTGRYVSGLDEGRGSLTFDSISAEQDGEYVLTVHIKKRGLYEKFLIAEVNGEPYEIQFPPQKHFNYTARFQIIVRLQKGKNTIKLYNPIANNIDSSKLQYRKMAEALRSASLQVAKERGEEVKPILFSICEWGRNKPWLWGASAGNMWRTTPDIRPIWTWIKLIYSKTVRLHEYSSAGHFNDPDMLEVGNGKLTYNQNLSHFALWCFMNAPLVLGNDIIKMPDNVLEILTNKSLIAINQDILCKQAKRVKAGCTDVLAKPLANGKTAVCFFNKIGGKRKIRFDLARLVEDKYVSASLKNTDIENIIGETSLNGTVAKAVVPKDGVAVFIIG